MLQLRLRVVRDRVVRPFHQETALDLRLVTGADGVTDSGRDHDVDLLSEPGRLRGTARTGLEAPAVDPTEPITDREQVWDVEPVFVDHGAFDVRDDGDSYPGPVQVAGGGTAHVAESLQRDRRPLQREPEDVGRLEGRFRHTVSRH